ncbi:hypothetical protein PVAG01_06643 [Phlyctema vagabunda]|uniref:Uncharacterized protein n=1 Tax=Phlyctema vagabunda TaxID=108571 RepID=A0ABR4PGM8_9HELO
MSNYPPETHEGIVTSWAPIATAFPPSQGCENLFWSVVQSTLAAWDAGYGISVDNNVRCMPPAVTSWWDQDRLGANSLTRVSLGPITCPVGYSTVLAQVENQSSTFVACCPPQYTFVEIVSQGNSGQCTSVIPANQIITFAALDQSSNWRTFTTSYTTASPAWGIPINGYNIAQVTATASTSTDTSGFTSASPTLSPSSGTASTSASPIPPPSSSLSIGAKCGIGIGVTLVAIALGTLIFFILARRKSRRNDHFGAVPTSAYGSEMVYTDQDQVHELENRRDVGMSELDGSEGPIKPTPVQMQPKTH